MTERSTAPRVEMRRRAGDHVTPSDDQSGEAAIDWLFAEAVFAGADRRRPEPKPRSGARRRAGR